MNKYIITSISYGIVRNLYYTKNITITEKINYNITEVSNNMWDVPSTDLSSERKVTRPLLVGEKIKALCFGILTSTATMPYDILHDIIYIERKKKNILSNNNDFVPLSILFACNYGVKFTHK